MRAWRAANYGKAKLAWLRNRAKKKNVPFDLTLEWLEQWLKDNNYDPTIHHIDRIKTWLGYTKDNIQVLDIGENVAKGNRERRGQLFLCTANEPF